MSDYKDTLNLPETGFPMRGNLANREPEMLKRWYDEDLYGEIRKAKNRFDMDTITAKERGKEMARGEKRYHEM